MSNRVKIDVNSDIEGKSVIFVSHGALSVKAVSALALFAPAAIKLIDSGLNVSLHYNVEADTIEMSAKL